MNKILLAFVVLATGLASCNKEEQNTDAANETLAVANATLVSAGTVHLAQKTGTGTVKILRQPNGRYLLGLEGVYLNASHGLVIYLAPESTLSSRAVKICSVPQLNGTALYPLPEGFDLSLFNFLIIQTEPWEETVASAKLG